MPSYFQETLSNWANKILIYFGCCICTIIWLVDIVRGSSILMSCSSSCHFPLDLFVCTPIVIFPILVCVDPICHFSIRCMFPSGLAFITYLSAIWQCNKQLVCWYFLSCMSCCSNLAHMHSYGFLMCRHRWREGFAGSWTSSKTPCGLQFRDDPQYSWDHKHVQLVPYMTLLHLQVLALFWHGNTAWSRQPGFYFAPLLQLVVTTRWSACGGGKWLRNFILSCV
jgi:hypothetical protein